ncbi:MAG: glycosyltransferase family 2 protein [Patescibacteria group bacterium]
MSGIYVVIPAYNEAQRIGEVLQSLIKLPYSLVVVDDGSSDNTTEIVAQYPVIFLRHKINRGQGAALYTGTLYALSQEADAIVHFDADGQFLAGEIERLLEPILSRQADIVFGSKFLQSNKIPFLKKLFIIRPAIWLNNIMTGLPLTDVHNGFRAMSGSAARQIDIKQDAMAHASEIVSQTKKLKLRYQEVPVTVIYREFGQGFFGGIKILLDLFIKKINQ